MPKPLCGGGHGILSPQFSPVLHLTTGHVYMDESGQNVPMALSSTWGPAPFLSRLLGQQDSSILFFFKFLGYQDLSGHTIYRLREVAAQPLWGWTVQLGGWWVWVQGCLCPTLYGQKYLSLGHQGFFLTLMKDELLSPCAQPLILIYDLFWLLSPLVLDTATGKMIGVSSGLPAPGFVWVGGSGNLVFLTFPVQA